MRKETTFSILNLLSLILLAPVWALAAGAGTAGGQTLKRGLSPRAESLAGVYTAFADDVYSLYYNPAGMARTLRPEITTAYNSGLVDDGLGLMAGVLPYDETLTFGLGLAYYNAGKFDYVDAQGASRKIMNAQTDILIDMAGAYQLTDDLAVGATAKLLISTLLEDYHGSALALDLGGMYRPDLPILQNRLRLGLAVLNLGTPMRYQDVADPLPIQARLGARYEIFRNDPKTKTPHELAAGLEVQGDLEGVLACNLGVEYCFQKMLSARLGYQLLSDLKGLTAGLGFEQEVFGNNAIRLDYSFNLVQKFNSTHKLSLTYALGRDPRRLTDWDRDQRKKGVQKAVQEQKKVEQEIDREKKNQDAFPVATTEVLEIEKANGQPARLILNIGSSGSRIKKGMIGYIYNLASGSKILAGKCSISEIYSSRSTAVIQNKQGDITTKCVVEIKP